MKNKLKTWLAAFRERRLWLILLPVLLALVLAAACHRRSPAAEPAALPVTVAEPEPRLSAAHEANLDSLAWITIPGTGIDFPVQQYTDNLYYLRRDAEGNEDIHGCVFADYECSLDSVRDLSRNLIFYGHTFTQDDYSGGFEDLHQYRLYDFGVEHPYIYVSLRDAKLTYQIFSTGVCSAAEDTDCIIADPDDAQFQTILDKAAARCSFAYGVSANLDDHILTLSTCTNDSGWRYLVVAKLVDAVEAG